MKKTTSKAGKALPCGMFSLKMFQLPRPKALIIAYLDLRSGLKRFHYNVTDIIKQTRLGETVVRQFVKELESEDVLIRLGISFYELDEQKMRELYYAEVSGSDSKASNPDTTVSGNDTKVSGSDSIHSSYLNSKKIDSSKLDYKQQPASNPVAETIEVSAPSILEKEPSSKKSLRQQLDELFGEPLEKEPSLKKSLVQQWEEMFP